MKLATLKDGSRDGQLVVVSRDLASAHYATGMATTLRQLLDDWNFISPQLEDLYATLNGGKARHAFALDPRHCMAPLPRTGHWLCGLASAGKAGDAGVAAGPAPEPAAEYLPSDPFCGPCECPRTGVPVAARDLEVTLVAATGDIDTGAGAEAALEGVRLLMLACQWRLRPVPHGQRLPGGDADEDPVTAPAPRETWVHRHLATSFAPVAVTPEELGPAWQGGRLRGRLGVRRNGQPLADSSIGWANAVDLGPWLAQAVRTRPLQAGSLVGSGPLAWADPAHPAIPEGPVDPAAPAKPAGGHAPSPCSLAGLHALQAQPGRPLSAALQAGDRLQVELTAADGHSLFGSITLDLPVEAAASTAPSAPDATPVPADAQAHAAAQAPAPAVPAGGPAAA